ncbi:tryptophan--tRNA ligase [Candidatus Palauibacter soopunensis]|uniref:tryptophan--tRNA ligase n=1 Tax=Candidatus Palauibacter soopunensis TaxID=3056739 RepID=UPI0023A49D42|nr:tryptophan--tRNA ligase [Candidatus Palauibacter soopunensis]MDE2878681.1 tryptophan--tRNA ligase [Candidatus Palauibacter soopunensis]
MTDRAPSGPRKRVFSGIQPTGHAHLGNYLGVFRRWAAMVDEYECYYCIVDLHAITREYEREDLLRRVFDLTVSLVASGIDPERCTLFAQSHVPYHSELQWLFNTVTPVGDLGRMTQYKEKSQGRESVNAGLLNYPVLQAADILLYRAHFVPVGEDQRQHLELSREVARRWNGRFGDFFPEPETLVGTGARVRGLDGVAKMSKSKDNTVRMVAEPDELWARLRTAVTDPARVRKDDPGNPHVCNVFALHEFFTDPADRAEIEILCQTAGIGCVACKRQLTDNVAEELAPVRERAAELRAHPERVIEILAAGAERARAEAARTMEVVRERMGVGPRTLDADLPGLAAAATAGAATAGDGG